MILIKNINVYAPDNLGTKDILICSDKIELIEEEICLDLKSVEVIDGHGKTIIPGLIDSHVHVTGGGGEGGVTTRVPELHISDLIKNGITTVLGLLGTDGTTRSVEALVAKTKSLKELGITAYALTGSYEYPTVTLTDSIKRDMVFIEEIIGCKIALSDHRSSHVSNHELARVASNTKVAGMLAKKPGILTVHMGDGKRGLSPIFEVLEETDLPILTFRPTHLNRNDQLLMESFDFAKLGGFVDYTCGIDKYNRPADIIEKMKTEKIPTKRVTISSDGFGSFSSYDQEGNLIKIGSSPVNSLLNELKYFVMDKKWSLSDALPYITSNVAEALGQGDKKGKVLVGYDADLLILDEGLNINTYIAKGSILYREGCFKRQFPYG